MPKQTSSVPCPTRNMSVEYFLPEDDGQPKPGILFLPDLTGVGTTLRETAELLAHEGFVVMVPDLYSEIGGPRYCMQMFFEKMNRNNEADTPPLREIHTLVDTLKAHEGVDAGRIGMVGQCLTGGFALHMSLREDIKAPVVFHHSLGLSGSGFPEEHTAQICQHMQGHFVRVDPFCPPWRVDKLLRQYGSKMEAHYYPDLPHGVPHFFRLTDSGRAAWRNMLTFLKAQLLD